MLNDIARISRWSRPRQEQQMAEPESRLLFGSDSYQEDPVIVFVIAISQKQPQRVAFPNYSILVGVIRIEGTFNGDDVCERAAAVHAEAYVDSVPNVVKSTSASIPHPGQTLNRVGEQILRISRDRAIYFSGGRNHRELLRLTFTDPGRVASRPRSPDNGVPLAHRARYGYEIPSPRIKSFRAGNPHTICLPENCLYDIAPFKVLRVGASSSSKTCTRSFRK